MASKQAARIALTIFWLLLLTVDAAATTGNQWKQLPRLSQDAYIFGVADTWRNFAQMEQYGKNSPNVKQPPQGTSGRLIIEVANCITKGMTYGQVVSIVGKFMDDNPSQWHYDMASLAWSAVHKACY